MDFQGGCLCGNTRYAVVAADLYVTDCHCIDCQRSAGAPFVRWGAMPRGAFRLVKGSLRKVSWAGRIRGFAACCGTHLTLEDSADDPILEITVASLDQAATVKPEKVIWTEDRLPGVSLDPNVPAFARNENGDP